MYGKAKVNGRVPPIGFFFLFFFIVGFHDDLGPWIHSITCYTHRCALCTRKTAGTLDTQTDAWQCAQRPIIALFFQYDQLPMSTALHLVLCMVPHALAWSDKTYQNTFHKFVQNVYCLKLKLIVCCWILPCRSTSSITGKLYGQEYLTFESANHCSHTKKLKKNNNKKTATWNT